MANTYKDIVITPNKSSSTDDPKIVFSGANTSVNTDITLRVYPESNGTLSFEGSSGQLFSITNDLTGSIFSVNDISGIPSIDVQANGAISIAPYGGNVAIDAATLFVDTVGNYVGIGTTTPIYKLDIAGTLRVNPGAGTYNLFETGVTRFYNTAGAAGNNTSELQGFQVYQPTASTDASMTFHVGGDYAVHFGLDGYTNDLFVGGWSMGAVKYKIWHAGNDGTGSGLDADLLDGQHGSYYAPLASPTFTGTVNMNANNASQTLTDAATIAWDVSLGQIATVTLTAAGRTMGAPTNLKVGTYILHVVQDATGSRTITTWNSVFKWPMGVAPVLTTTASARDLFSFVCDGTNLYGSFLPDVK